MARPEVTDAMVEAALRIFDRTDVALSKGIMRAALEAALAVAAAQSHHDVHYSSDRYSGPWWKVARQITRDEIDLLIEAYVSTPLVHERITRLRKERDSR